MSTLTSVEEISSHGGPSAGGWPRLGTALETLTIFAGILYYIWRWQATFPHAWLALLAAILLSHLAHRDTFHKLGLAWSGLRASSEVVFPLALAIYIPLFVYGFARHSLALLRPTPNALPPLLGYAVWCLAQQYLTQSYFHNRLMSLLPNRHLTSLLVGLMFGSAHIPNPILMIATTLAGFIFSEIFARHRNIWALALAQALGGLLLAAVSPASLMHNMRVGPGYFFFGLR
jgi:hypothetical protein